MIAVGNGDTRFAAADAATCTIVTGMDKSMRSPATNATLGFALDQAADHPSCAEQVIKGLRPTVNLGQVRTWLCHLTIY